MLYLRTFLFTFTTKVTLFETSGGLGGGVGMGGVGGTGGVSEMRSEPGGGDAKSVRVILGLSIL